MGNENLKAVWAKYFQQDNFSEKLSTGEGTQRHPISNSFPPVILTKVNQPH